MDSCDASDNNFSISVTNSLRLDYAFSASVFAIVAASTLHDPWYGVVTFPFLPTKYSVSCPTALAMLMTTDAVGIVRGWKFFAHAAHLGGTDRSQLLVFGKFEVLSEAFAMKMRMTRLTSIVVNEMATFPAKVSRYLYMG